MLGKKNKQWQHDDILEAKEVCNTTASEHSVLHVCSHPLYTYHICYYLPCWLDSRTTLSPHSCVCMFYTDQWDELKAQHSRLEEAVLKRLQTATNHHCNVFSYTLIFDKKKLNIKVKWMRATLNIGTFNGLSVKKWTLSINFRLCNNHIMCSLKSIKKKTKKQQPRF